MRALILVLLSTTAHAEAGWLTAQGRITEGAELAVFGGPKSVGVGLLRSDNHDPARGIGAEVAWSLSDRVVELSAARRWQLGAPGKASFSGTVGLAGFIVPEGKFNLALGPNAGLNAGFGGKGFSFEVGVLSGIELFTRGLFRFPQRLQLGVRAQIGRVTLRLYGRAGVDLILERSYIIRADAVLSVGLLSRP